MSEFRRRFVRLSVLLLPAFLALAGLYGFRGDLRDAAARTPKSGFVRDGNTFYIRGRERQESLAAWVSELVGKLKDRYGAIYGFAIPRSGFVIVVTREGVGSEWVPGSNQIEIRGIPDDASIEGIKGTLSRLIARAMLREGAPGAEFSPWFEEGVSRYFEGSQPPYGSKKADLILRARQAAPPLAYALKDRGGPGFEAVSHSIVAFIHDRPTDRIALYVAEERKSGPVPMGTFEKIFGDDVEGAWHDFLERPRIGN